MSTASAPSAAAMYSYLPGDGGAISDANLSALQAGFARLSASTSSAPAAATSSLPAAGSISMGLSEFALFKGLGNSTPQATFNEFAGSPDVVYGKNHALAGDVDDSGCTDIADYNIITQEDVFGQRAVLPLEIAVRADITRDGWVNFQDLDLLFDHWGEGCLNATGTPPYPAACYNHAVSGTETDVDCGGICKGCPNGGGCNVASDCTSGVCSGNVCQPATCSDGVQNQGELDVDCGGPKCGACTNRIVVKALVANSWPGGYCANLQIKNVGTKPTKNWNVKLNATGSTLYNKWSATYSANTGNITVTPASFNKVINPGQTNTTAGFCANLATPGGPVATVTSATATF
jgi:hypothetical protein